MYLLERILLAFMWIISLISLLFIPKNLYRQTSFIFLFTQLPSWIFGLIVVEAGWIEYPVRELHKANATSFTFEFFVLPIMCIFFNIYYPDKEYIYKKIIYYITFLGCFTLVEYCVVKYTKLIDYIHWEWYITFITMSAVFYFVRSVYKWFFKLGKPFLL